VAGLLKPVTCTLVKLRKKPHVTIICYVPKNCNI
jgi:hypothetical protein